MAASATPPQASLNPKQSDFKDPGGRIYPSGGFEVSLPLPYTHHRHAGAAAPMAAPPMVLSEMFHQLPSCAPAAVDRPRSPLIREENRRTCSLSSAVKLGAAPALHLFGGSVSTKPNRDTSLPACKTIFER